MMGKGPERDVVVVVEKRGERGVGVVYLFIGVGYGMNVVVKVKVFV